MFLLLNSVILPKTKNLFQLSTTLEAVILGPLDEKKIVLLSSDQSIKG